MYIRDRCNLCLNEADNTVGRITRLRDETCPDVHWRAYFEMIGADGMDIEHLVCGRCGQIFQRQLIEDADLIRLEAVERSRSDVARPETSFERTREAMNTRRFEGVHRFLLNFFEGGSVLDVGGRTGAFGLPLIAQGADYTIIDLNDYTGRTVAGSTFVHGDFDTYDFGRRFDLVVMNHVLEHVFYPIETIERGWELLADGGLIFIDIPILPIWPGTYHRSEFYVKPLLLDLVRRGGFAVEDVEDVLIGYANSIIASCRVVARKSQKRDAPTRDYGDYSRNLLSEFHHDIIRHLGATGEPFVIYGAEEELLRAVDLDVPGFLGFVDDNPDRWGQTLFGKPVHSPKLLDATVGNIVIVASNKEEVRQRLFPLGEQGVHLIANHKYL